MSPGVTAVVVCSFEDPADVTATVRSLLAQTVVPSQIVVVDNHPEAVVSSALRAAGLPIEVVHTGRNIGYPPACDAAAPHARHEWMFFLNPDAAADPSCVASLLEAGADPDVAIVGAQVLLPDGETVNAGDNPVHLVGLSWSGRYLEPREDGPPRDVGAVSGAALMMRTSVYRELGGHCPGFFLYNDDTDIAWRARMAGWRVRFVPRAVITHDYEFVKGSHKWRHLEHNRWWSLLANYDLRTLVLLLPLLLAAEVGIAVLARRDGWWREKARAWRELAAEWREIGRWRRFVQRRRKVGDAEILRLFTASLDTPLVQTPAVARAEPMLRAYRAMVLALSRR